MRLALVAVVIALAGLAVFALNDDDSEPGSPAGGVALVGDSLNVGIEPYLPDELENWTIQNHNRSGRLTWEGIEVLREQRARLSSRLVISLGTNDPAGDVEGFSANVDAALSAAGPNRCVVWLTIHRDGREAFNDVLREEAEERPNLVLVDWAEMVRERPELLAGDKVHATEDGYAERAAAVARAVESCNLVRAEPA